MIPGNVFPVTTSPDSSGSKKGKSITPGYQSHYVVVTKKGMPASPTSRATFDEIIVGQVSQCLPIYAAVIGNTKKRKERHMTIKTAPVIETEKIKHEKEKKLPQVVGRKLFAATDVLHEDKPQRQSQKSEFETESDEDSNAELLRMGFKIEHESSQSDFSSEVINI